VANLRKKRKLSPRGVYTIAEWLQLQGYAPIMAYDAPQTDAAAKVRKMRKELAPHNFTVKYTPRGKYILAEPLDWDGTIRLHWLSTVDEIVCDNGGGCQ
jgi:hypothetical protein